MAKADYRLPEDFLDRIAKLGDQTDDIIPRVLAAGGDVVLEAVRKGLHGALSGQSTGELAASLGVSPARIDRDGNYNVKAGFSEPRSDGKSNAMLEPVRVRQAQPTAASFPPACEKLQPSRRNSRDEAKTRGRSD